MPLPKSTIVGRLVDDGTLRFSNSGSAVYRFRVAASDRRKNDQGEWEDGDRLFATCTAWSRLAESAAESLKKGDLVIVTGAWRTSEWTDKEGNRRSAIEFRVDDIGASLQFRTLPHQGASHEARAEAVGAGSTDPWTTPGQSPEPAF